MALLSTPLCNYGEKMPKFKLKNVDDSFIDQEMIKGKKWDINFFYLQPLSLCESYNKKIGLHS